MGDESAAWLPQQPETKQQGVKCSMCKAESWKDFRYVPPRSLWRPRTWLNDSRGWLRATCGGCGYVQNWRPGTIVCQTRSWTSGLFDA